MITTNLAAGLCNRLFNIIKIINISKEINIDCYFSDLYTFNMEHKTNYYYKDNVFKKLNFDYHTLDDVKNHKIKKDNIFEYFNENDCVLYNHSNNLDSNNFFYHDLSKITKFHDIKIINDYFDIDCLSYINRNRNKNIILTYNNTLYFNTIIYSIEYFNDLFIDKNILDEIYNKYYSILKNSLSIHIRRCDYFIYFPNCIKDISFYYRQIKIVDEYKHIDNILIFSDDILWCKTNLNDPRITFIDEKDYICLYLMTLCENHITSNSSFSLFGIMLNNIKNKLILSDIDNHYNFIFNDFKEYINLIL